MKLNLKISQTEPKRTFLKTFINTDEYKSKR